MRLLPLVLIGLLIIPYASANVLITEVMYNPEPYSDTDLEWIELYNNDSTPVDLTDWKINGAGFDDIILPANQYVVVARELIDGTDNDTESFEQVYGNNNGVWDEPYLAVDGSFSLVDDGSVILESPLGIQESLSYNGSWGGKGNGKSIYRVDIAQDNTQDNWKEHPFVNGNPGYGETNLVRVSFTVDTFVLEMQNISIADDLPLPGIQIIPTPASNRTIVISGHVNGAQNLEGSIEFNGNVVPITLENNTLSGSITVPSSLAPGAYPLAIHISDGSETANYNTTVTVQELLALHLENNALDFGAIKKNQNSSVHDVLFVNDGNINLNAHVMATPFSTNSTALGSEIINVVNGNDATPLTSPVTLPLHVAPGMHAPVRFMAKVPSNATSGSYSGAIAIMGVQ